MTTSTSGAPAHGLKQKLGSSASLLEAVDAASNWPAFILLSATWIASMISVAVFGALTAYLASKSGGLGAFSGFITFLLVTSILIVGVNATGIMLSDRLWGRTQRSIMDSVLASVFTCHRLLAVLVIEFLLFVVFMLLLAFVLFICKIPGIGPVLFAVVFPLGAIATGLVIFSLLYIAIPLAAPAIWNGASVKHTLLMLQAVARKRLLTTIIMTILMGLLILVTVGFVWSILGIGTTVVASLSTAVLDISGDGFASIMRMVTGSGGGGSGYLYAMGFGGAILLLVGANPGLLIGLKGLSIIYREVSAGLSLEEDEKAMDRRMQDIKARAEQARAQVAATAQRAQERAQEASMPAPALVPDPAPMVEAAACPACHNAITSEDVFCGGCGHKLK